MLEQAYSKVLKEDNHENIFHKEETIMFEDPKGLPYVYEVSYEKKMEHGFYNDSVVGVNINWAKAYKENSDEVLFDITDTTEPNVSDIQDWVYNFEIGDTKLNIL